MRAVCFQGAGKPPLITDISKPEAGPGQMLVKMGGAGVCHSDVSILEHELGFSGQFTLGHENAGWVSQLGEGVTGFKEGDAVAVYICWGCGRCHACCHQARLAVAERGQQHRPFGHWRPGSHGRASAS